MLCTVYDNISLRSLNRSHSYEHMASFHALQASADGGLCSLCCILWRAVDSYIARKAKNRHEEGDDEEKDDVLFMSYPVRLAVDGIISENREKAIDKLRNSCGKGNRNESHKFYNLCTAKAPAVLFVCSLQPEDFQLGLKLEARGSLSLYREPRKSIHLISYSVGSQKLNVRVGIDIFTGDPYAGRRVSSQANSAACFQLIAHWIRVCLTEHKHCRRAVCPYSWTEEADTWARSPSYLSSSSESDPSDELPVGETAQESGLDGTGPFNELDDEDDESQLYEVSETQILSERPPKRARQRSPGPATPSPFFSKGSATHSRPRPSMEASNLRQLQEVTAAQIVHTSSLTRRSPLSRGILGRRSHAPQRMENGSIDDGHYKLYLRSEELLSLRENSWERHAVDMPSETTPLLPTRYIYVDSSPPQLCIADPEARGFYVALSHCWGKSQPLMTTTDTLVDHQKGIPIKDMPRSFQDAVTIARELGIEYLWIDSLCILQDSKEDWEKESAKMGSVYGNAFLTISASASEDSKQGIFRPRTIPPGPPVEVRCNDSNFESIYIDYKLENTPFQESQSTDNRAWCFQEIALSPRVLVYGKEMLGWLCDSITDVEHGHVTEHDEDPDPPLLAPRLNPKPAENPLERLGFPFTLYHYCRERERSVGRWASMVNAFTKRKLTHETDRLPALSGIVKELQLQTGDEYLAGLWRQDLSHDLLWGVDISFAAKDAGLLRIGPRLGRGRRSKVPSA
jgi:hypothetical protein